MANKYDYSNVEFCNRIRLRKSIMSKNAIISKIAGSIGYNFNAAHTLIMDSFYGRTNDDIVAKYSDLVSPIDFFNAKALEHFSIYLERIIENWPDKKQTTTEYIKKAFEQLIKVEAELARFHCRKMGALPEHNDKATKLPVKIDGVMIKKAEETLKKAEIQTAGSAYSVIPSKPRKKPNNELSKKETQLVEVAVKETIKEIKKEQPTNEQQEVKTGKVKNGNILNELKKSSEMNLFNFKKFATKKPMSLESYIKTNQTKISNEKAKINDLQTKVEFYNIKKEELLEEISTARSEYKAQRPHMDSLKYVKLVEASAEEKTKVEQKIADTKIEIENSINNVNKLEQRIADRVNAEQNQDILEKQMK